MSLPTEWQYRTFGGGAAFAASIVIPAAGTAIRHILTGVEAKLLNNSAALVVKSVSALDGAAATVLTELYAPATSADSYAAEVIFVGSPGTSMTVRIDGAGVANVDQVLAIRGYDL